MGECRVLAAWVVVLSIFVYEMYIIRCEEQFVFLKGGEKADAGAGKF